MPLATASPVVLSTVEANFFEILSHKAVQATGLVEIEWHGGVKQADGTVAWSCGGVQSVSYAKYALVPPDPVKYPTLYHQTKAQLYLAMQDAGGFPTGTVS